MNGRVLRVVFLSVTLVMLSLADSAFAQRVFMGNAYKQDEFIYEDRLLDDGTRSIMSNMWDIGDYAFSLCRFISVDGESWYGFAVESKEHIPKNGLLVFVPASGSGVPILLGQTQSGSATVSKAVSRLSPSFIFGGGGSTIAFTSYTSIVDKDVSFAVYDMSEKTILTLVSDGISDMRISSRSTYNTLKPWATKKMSEWLGEAKGYVDARAEKSVNCILDGLE